MTNRGNARVKRPQGVRLTSDGNPPRCNPRTNSIARTFVEIRSIDEAKASLSDKLSPRNRIWLTIFPGKYFPQTYKNSDMDIQKLINEGVFKRNYRKSALKSTINPAIAFALNKLAGIEENDRILDPCCGTGTILIERQLLKPCICVGVDIDPRALESAKENIKAANVEIELKHGDIMDKKIPNGYFTKIISNLPYGIHTGSREKNKQLYRFLADKAIHWLKPGGKAVFITNAKTLLRNSFAFNPQWQLLEEISLEVSGLKLSIFIYQKANR